MQRYLVAKNYNICFPNEMDLSVSHKKIDMDVTPDKFENGNGEAYTVHTNPSPQRIFSKTVFKSKEFENAVFSFSCGQKIFCKRGFSKTMVSR